MSLRYRDWAIVGVGTELRRDLRELHVLDEDIAQLQPLTSYRADLAADRTRSINRLRGLLTSIFLPWSECWTSPTVAR
jgi:hypothetical protein